MRLNHVANRVSRGCLDLMVEVFTAELGFRLLRRIPTDVWLRQEPALVDLQFCETEAEVCRGDKHNSHISFLSPDPESQLKALSASFESRGYQTRLGQWSDKEFWLDVPEVFIDFVIECMKPELAEYKLS